MRFKSEEEERKFVKGCEEFKDYSSVDEYIEDAVMCLALYRPWHYTEETARDRLENYREYVERCYSDKIPADDLAMDVGFTCG